MSIKATVDGTAYTGIESIVTGGKTIALEEVLSQSGLNWASGVVEAGTDKKLPTITHNLGTTNYIIIMAAQPDDSGVISITNQYTGFLYVYCPIHLFIDSELNFDCSAYNSNASNPFTYTGSASDDFVGFALGTPPNGGTSVYFSYVMKSLFTAGENSFVFNSQTNIKKFKWYAIDVSVSG